MTLLKIKSKIYKYTGLDLTSPEKMKYIASEEFSKELVRIKRADKTMRVNTIISILIGLWEAHNGITRIYFYNRRLTILRFKYPLLSKVVSPIIQVYANIRSDLVENKKEVRKVLDVVVLAAFILLVVKLLLSLRG